MTILLVDDHPIVLEGMRTLLASLPNTSFASATTAARAREIIDGSMVDIMIADLELGGDSGLALAEYLHERQPAARVAIYTM
ncbi:MAG: response regulator, partial [Prevotella sp.]|nr:response regulator [Prevotella sp.]